MTPWTSAILRVKIKSTEMFSIICLVKRKYYRNFVAYFYVNTIKYAVKRWFLNEKQRKQRRQHSYCPTDITDEHRFIIIRMSTDIIEEKNCYT